MVADRTDRKRLNATKASGSATDANLAPRCAQLAFQAHAASGLSWPDLPPMAIASLT